MKIVVDTETNALEDPTKLWSVAIRDADTGRLLASTTDGDHSESLRVLWQADELVGHNIIGFDLDVLRRFLAFCPRDNQKITDTLVMSRVIHAGLREEDWGRPGFPTKLIGSHSLKAWGVRLGVLKGDYGETENCWDAWSPEMQKYCEGDTETTLALYRHLMSRGVPDRCLNLEHGVAFICHRIHQSGWTFDRDAADSLVASLLGAKAQILQRLVEVFPPRIEVLKTKTKTYPFNPGSRKDIARALKELHGWEPIEFTTPPKGSKAAPSPRIDEEILGSLPYPEAALLCEYLMIVKRLGQVSEGAEAWMNLVKKDGRIHGRINPNGAVTGRATHSNPNMAQVPSVRKPYGKQCRSLFRPRKGWTLVGADASSLELRCLAHFLARYDGGEYGKIVVSGDAHWANAQAFCLVKAGTPRDKGNPDLEAKREVSKTLIYAIVYGAGDVKLGQIAGTDAKQGAKLRRSFEKNLPAYKSLKDDVAEAALRGYLVGLDGRHLPVRSPHSALNTLLQSAGALVMKQGLVNLTSSLTTLGLAEQIDFAISGWIHDEYQIECRPELAGDVGACAVGAIEDAGQDFRFRVPLSGEWKSGASWGDTH